MLAGESAGGASVINHLARRRSWGLFSAAAQESGGYSLVQGQPGIPEQQRYFDLVAKEVGCTGSDRLARLQSKDSAGIL